MTCRVQRLPLLAILVTALIVASGCVWLRLLDLKDQFADFDRWIEVPDGPGVELRFRKPVLMADDLDTLIRANPTATAEAAGIQVRTYAFSHIPSPDGADAAGAEPILVISAGIRAGRVVFLGLPPEVFRVIPRDLAVRAMRSLGRARVDTAQRSAVADVDLDGISAPLPGRTGLVALFGRPNRISLLDGRERLLWRYTLVGAPLREDGQPVVAAMAFLFTPGGDRPLRFQANISGMWVSLDLPADAAGAPGPRPLPAPVAPDPPAALPAAR